ncbi:pyridoxal phosphate-dependent aminotransferase [Arthrospira platensis]|uniref:Aspartate aminotransferase n=2 Tax=Limnospira platensis TaxID=118562 RepID=A0A5M3TE46_LIMPL|nr:pyridoxal phosphate-dependent aminotransferase [Arthrospira platensis]AMW31638.1 aspartate aminotransferase [Arthrospira platensis YZ]KDR56247.1 aspartate aminotransferase [Arthrospira platensis str. Paraca]MBD2671213.1 pyridoxal phosphate-dependent aminotransferase [Arthrospira platensis FACHB-439]MBD2712602.1 pyridoxal phosphate-dependent aminotransferase [Arthrospira platensis FACHB-835]MDF2210376.1 pyridoxal phosphate-dependent aminotransferase [Arthrospira platensis NCB002]MDT9185243.
MNLDYSRMQSVQSPIIPIIGKLINNHPGTISLGQGVVYYGPPPVAFDQISEFLASPENHKYKPVIGINPLLEIIADKLQTENHINLSDRQKIVVTAGSNMGFMNGILAITSPGDEIIIQSPYYFNHEMAIIMASCQPVVIQTDDHYQLRIDAIKAAITDKTRAIVTISPNNPTGAVYSPEALQEINQICGDRNLYHISDEAYEYFTYNNIKHTSPATFPNSESHTISLFSLSKAYGFASWRIGYMLIPEHLLIPIQKVQDTILICPPVISQYVALGALKVGYEYCQNHIKTITEVRDIFLNELSQLSDFCTIPQADGAFYFLLKIDTQLDSMELAQQLIKQFGVAVIPGTTFGMSQGCYLRVAYGALKPDTAAEGIGRLVKGLKTLVI